MSKGGSKQSSPSGNRIPSHDVKDLAFADAGRKRVEWADQQMPVLRAIRERFGREQPLKGLKMAACLHITCETANLLRALKAGGAEVVCCASNPVSTQDDVAAALTRHYGIDAYAIHGENRDTYYGHLRSVLERRPSITMDDGADLVNLLHAEYAAQAKDVIASMEETTTGVIRLRAMEKKRALKIPVVAVNDAQTKYLFDNRYGTGQSTLDGVIRATGVLLAGSLLVIGGYGWCGRGIASRARGMGANVIVTEVNPVRALEAALEGFRVMPMEDAAPIGDIFITATGDKHVIRSNHLNAMKDGAIVCNSGHFDIEIDMAYLNDAASKIDSGAAKNVDAYHLANGRRIYVLGQGRLVNLVCAEGHPAQVMDMSFATQALASSWVVSGAKLEVKVHEVPQHLVDDVANLKLAAMGIKIDELTPEQKHYLSSWEVGT